MFFPTRSLRHAWPVLLVLLLPCGTARAETHGGIEIGSTGVKATVVQAVQTADGLELRVLFADTVNTALVSSAAKTGDFNADDVKKTTDAVARFHAMFLKELKVAAERIYVVGSSGLLVPFKDDAHLTANKKTLSDAVRAATGVTMDFLTAKREAELSIDGILPRVVGDTGVVIDIGGGNTKGGYHDRATGKYVTLAVPFGSRTLADAIRKKADADGTAYQLVAPKVRDDVLRPALRKELEKAPGLSERPRVFLSGGAAWAVATLTHPADRSPYTTLTPADFGAIAEKLAANTHALPLPDLTTIKDDALRKEVEAELKRVQEAFPVQNLIAGVEVLRALDAEMGLAKKRVVFARNGYLGWLLAYIGEKEK
jgi:exopolyphosphatase/pppGpp-phosphohydrolase